MGDGELSSKERKRDRMKRYAKRAVAVPLSVRTSDLPKRAASAVVMLVVLLGVPYLFGEIAILTLVYLVLAVGFGELIRLLFRVSRNLAFRAGAILAGAAYFLPSVALVTEKPTAIFWLVAVVASIDIFAYFFGRTIGGPRIAPSISPSKTWAGLFGGAVGAVIMLIVISRVHAAFACDWIIYIADGGLLGGAEEELPPGVFSFDSRCHIGPRPFNIGFFFEVVVVGAGLAIVAQAGDFLESWIKRKAAMKDSSNLIPGHGGVLDRVDGMLAVAIVAAFGVLFLDA